MNLSPEVRTTQVSSNRCPRPGVDGQVCQESCVSHTRRSRRSKYNFPPSSPDRPFEGEGDKPTGPHWVTVTNCHISCSLEQVSHRGFRLTFTFTFFKHYRKLNVHNGTVHNNVLFRRLYHIVWKNVFVSHRSITEKEGSSSLLKHMTDLGVYGTWMSVR